MKKVLFIVLPILLVGGGVVGAAKMGAIQIPGLSPKKKSTAAAQYGEGKDDKVAKADPPKKKIDKPKIEAKSQPAAPAEDPALGHARIAMIWNELEVGSIEAIIADWKEDELAAIFSRMNPDKLTEVLNAMAAKDPKRASRLTKAIQKIASAAVPTDGKA